MTRARLHKEQRVELQPASSVNEEQALMVVPLEVEGEGTLRRGEELEQVALREVDRHGEELALGARPQPQLQPARSYHCGQD